jgi:hypothetical protein
MKKRILTGHATASVTSSIDKFGPLTRSAIDSLSGKPSTASPGVGIRAAWFDEYPIGPSDYYLRTGKIEFGPTSPAPDLLYRPNDRITLADIERAKAQCEAARVQYPHGTGTKKAEPAYRVEINKAGHITGMRLEGQGKSTLAQVGGDHYAKLAIDPFDYAMANKLDPLQMTVIKYTTRFRDKGGVQDLRKAIHTLERLIAFEGSRK